MTVSPFDFVNAITISKKDIIKESENPALMEKEYSPFIVNKALSYFTDTILYANEMNMNAHLDNKLQFQYLINSIRPKKRFAKWVKAVSEDNLELVKTYYGYSNEKAHQVLSILSDDQLEMIRKKQEQGG